MLDPQEKLARMYVEEFLRGKGYSFDTVRQLPAEQCKKIMVEASTYAACKLAEVERRAHIMEEIHGVSESS